MPSEWTINTLKELIDVKFAAAKEAISIALSASEKAITKAESANERRLDLLNEFRAQQADEARKYAPTELVNQRFSSIEERVARGEQALATLQGRALALAAVGTVVGAVLGAFAGKLIG